MGINKVFFGVLLLSSLFHIGKGYICSQMKYLLLPTGIACI